MPSPRAIPAALKYFGRGSAGPAALRPSATSSTPPASASAAWPHLECGVGAARCRGSARYLAAAIPALASGRSFEVTLCLDDSFSATFDITTAAVANGQYQGGGIRIAPEADIEDGLADVTVVERVSLAEVAANLPILYSGALYSHPKVRHWRAARVRAEAETEVPVELDGEPVGTLPLEVEALPQALRFILPPLRQAGR